MVGERGQGGVKRITSGKTSGTKQDLCHSLKNSPKQQTRHKPYLEVLAVAGCTQEPPDPLQADRNWRRHLCPGTGSPCAAANQQFPDSLLPIPSHPITHSIPAASSPLECPRELQSSHTRSLPGGTLGITPSWTDAPGASAEHSQ